MAYLDVSPMIGALRERPDEFDMKRGWLRHTPSRHKFRFDDDGRVRLDTTCQCAFLAIKQEQERELKQAYDLWYDAYWRPTEINRQFASHFRAPGLWRRTYRKLLARLRGLRQDRLPDSEPVIAGRTRVRR